MYSMDVRNNDKNTASGAVGSRHIIISSLLWKMFERGGNAVVQLAVQIVMARLLAPEQFGMLSIMLVFVNLGNVVVQSGMNTALIQAPEVRRVDCSTVFWMSFAVSAVLYAAVFLAAPAISAFYALPGLVWPLRALALLLVVNAYNAVQIALITRRLEMRKIFNATVLSSAVSAACGIGCAVAGAGVWALVAQQLSYQVSNCLAHAAQLDWRPHLEFSAASARRLFGFGSRLLVSGLLDQGYQSLSDLIIGRQFSAASLGYVSQGKRYPQAVGSLLDGAIQPVMLSAVSRAQDDAAQVKRLVRRALKTSSYLIAPAMVLFATVAPSLVPLLLGDQWRDSVWFMQVYCLVYALLPIHTTNLQALNGVGRSDLFLKLEVIKKGYGIAAILLCAFVLCDVRAMVASYFVTDVISTFVNAWPNRRVIGYSYGEQVRDIFPAFLMAAAAAVAASLVGLLALPPAALIALQALAFAAAYVGLSALFRVEEYAYLVGTARGMLRGRAPK